MPLKNFVLETASAPGTATTVSLIGPAAGRMSFVGAGFANGATVEYYFMDDGTIFEYGIGTFHTGSPNTLDRTTVIGNSSGTTARLSFAGTTDIYNEIPAERAVFVNAQGTVVIPGGLQVSGAFQQAQTITGKSANYAILTSDRGARLVAAVTVAFTLPTAAAAAAGWSVDITNNSPPSAPVVVSVARASTDIIDATGDTIAYVLPGETVTFTSTGVAWLTTGRTPRQRLIGFNGTAFAGSTTSSTTAVNLLGSGLTYQPISKTSFIDIRIAFWASVTGVAGIATSAFFRLSETGGAAVVGATYQLVVNVSNTEIRAMGIVEATIANTALTPRVFQLQGWASSASAVASGTSVNMTISEVQNG